MNLAEIKAWRADCSYTQGGKIDQIIAELERVQKLADNRLENIKAMSSYLDDVAEALGVAKPGTPVEGIGACWNVLEAIIALQQQEQAYADRCAKMARDFESGK